MLFTANQQNMHAFQHQVGHFSFDWQRYRQREAIYRKNQHLVIKCIAQNYHESVLSRHNRSKQRNTCTGNIIKCHLFLTKRQNIRKNSYFILINTFGKKLRIFLIQFQNDSAKFIPCKVNKSRKSLAFGAA